jgi:phosphoglycolate phosphatase
VDDATQAGDAARAISGERCDRMHAGANVLLDLDGTLTDPRIGFVESINYALSGLGLAPVPPDTIAQHIGPPLEETLTILLGPQYSHHLESAVSLYAERYSTHGVFECTVYPGIPESLHALQQSGARLFVATSKPHVLAQRIIEHFGLTPFFSGAYGSELDGTRSDKRQLLAYILEQESLVPAATVMVGDRAQDIWAARSNGLSSIGVLWGYGSRDELVGAGATTIIERPGALLGKVGA